MEMWLFGLRLATNVASDEILLDTAVLDNTIWNGDGQRDICTKLFYDTFIIYRL